MVKGPQNQLHTAATPPTVAQKQVRKWLGNYVYISKFTKHIVNFPKHVNMLNKAFSYLAWQH